MGKFLKTLHTVLNMKKNAFDTKIFEEITDLVIMFTI